MVSPNLCGNRDRDKIDVSQKMPRITRNYQKLEKTKKHSSLELSQGVWPCWPFEFRPLASPALTE